MKTWIKPSGKIERFVANDCVAACWGVACTIAIGDNRAAQKEYESQFPDFDSDQTYHHDPLHCGSLSNQFLYDSNGDGKIDGMKEINSINPEAKHGELECTVFTDKTYTTRLTDFSSIGNGQTIYWTDQDSSRIWHHQGPAQITSGNSTNHS